MQDAINMQRKNIEYRKEKNRINMLINCTLAQSYVGEGGCVRDEQGIVC